MERRLMLLAVLLIIGCSQSSGNRPKTVPATGTVTLNGTAVEGATVNFIPMEAGGNSAIGRTDANGKYSLTTFRSNDGAVPGQYKVSITKYEGGAPPAAATGSAGSLASGDIDLSTYKEPTATDGSAPAAAPTGPKNLIPAQYSNADSSGLRGMVEASGSNENDFPLK